MYWADKLADQIIKSRKHKPFWVDDMKTPSGRVHIGSVRAVLTHELIYRALLDHGVKAVFSYVLDDHDPMVSLPSYLDKKKYRQHLGKPLYKIPSPDKGFKSYGHQWGQEYIHVFNAMGVKPKIIWSSQLYLSGKMNKVIKVCLDNADTIRRIYKQLYGKGKPKDWYPFYAECEDCGKLSTVAVTGWNGKHVTYQCRKDAVPWTQGCGKKGQVSPYNGNGKLPWKVEWACKWKVIGVTIEGAGKDHMTQGGSHDVAKLICKRVIKYPVPFAFSHEFFLVGGKKMSSSKGLGSSAKEVSKIIPPYLIRFMIARVKYNRAIDFDPGRMTIPDLFDEYDDAALSFWKKKDNKMARVYELSQVKGKPPAEHFLPRFRDVAAFIQYPEIDAQEKFAEIKGTKLTGREETVLQERKKYAEIWLKGYAPAEVIFTPTLEVPKQARRLSETQKAYLHAVVTILGKRWKDPDELQKALYEQSKTMNIPSGKAFGALYLALLGKNHGPRAAGLLLEYNELAKKRFLLVAHR